MNVYDRKNCFINKKMWLKDKVHVLKSIKYINQQTNRNFFHVEQNLMILEI